MSQIYNGKTQTGYALLLESLNFREKNFTAYEWRRLLDLCQDAQERVWIRQKIESFKQK